MVKWIITICFYLNLTTCSTIGFLGAHRYCFMAATEFFFIGPVLALSERDNSFKHDLTLSVLSKVWHLLFDSCFYQRGCVY